MRSEVTNSGKGGKINVDKIRWWGTALKQDNRRSELQMIDDGGEWDA